MGWTWQKASHYYPNGNIDRKAECDAYFTEGLNEGQYEILKSTMVGGVYYAAVKKLKQYCSENADGKSQFTDLPPDKQRWLFFMICVNTENGIKYRMVIGLVSRKAAYCP